MPIRLISKSAFHPGGRIYRQAETNWEMPNPMAITWDTAVKEIQNHRKLNPGFPFPTTYEACDWDLENYTCLRLGNSPLFCRNDDPHAPALIQQPRVTSQPGCKTC